MNANAVNIAIVDGKTITQTVELSSAKNGQPIRIKAVQGGKYILAESVSGVAPENITIKRVGKNLHIALEGSDPDQPQLIIEDFEGSGGQLVGVAEDGSYHEYISSDAEQDRSAAFLIDGVSAPQVLGSSPLVGFGDGLVAAASIGWFWPALLGLAALGLLGGIYAATRDDGGNDSDHGGGANLDKGALDSADDNVGDKQGLIENGGSTDDRTPTFGGGGRPGTSVEIIDNGKTIGTAIVGEDGTWKYTPPEPGLEDGSHVIVIVPIDEDGNKGDPSPDYEVIVDTVAPASPLIDSVYDDVAPVEGALINGGHTNDTTPTLSGTGEAGSVIHIYDNGVEIGSVLAGTDGKWSFITPVLGEGPHEFTVTSEDAAGNISAPSLPFPIIVDITPPTRPGDETGGIDDVLDNVGPIQGGIENGGTTDDTTPTIIGSGAEPGDTVIVIDNGNPIGTAIVGEDGKWKFEPEPELEPGTHEIVVVIKDPAGNESEPSTPPYVIIVDPNSPGKPGAGTGGIDDIVDDVGLIQGSIENGDQTDDNTPTLVGTGGQPGDTVIIYDNGIQIGTEIVDQYGKWEHVPDPVLAEGPHEIVVVLKDPDGKQSDPSDPHTFIVDTTAPGKPGTGTGGIDMVEDNVGPDQDNIENGGTTDDDTPTFSGGGLEPGDTVIIIDNGTQIGTEIVGEDGTWQHTPDPALPEGPHEVVIVIRDPAGNESEPSDPWTVIIDLTPPTVPTIDSVFDDQGTSPGDIDKGGTTDDAQPLISGTGEPDTTIIIYDNGVEIGREPVDSKGNWTHLPVPPLLNGSHVLSAVGIDLASNVSKPSTDFDFNLIAGGLPAAPSITGVADDVPEEVGNIGPDGHTNDVEPQVSGTAEPLSTVELFANGVSVGTITADALGNWTITPSPVLSEGLNNLTVTATNAAGNVSPTSGNYPITVDTESPDAADGTLTDNVGDIVGPIEKDDTTDDSTPAFTGTAEPGTTVIIYDKGVEIGRAPVKPDGSWTFIPAPALIDGNHSLSTVVVDDAGNRSPESTPIDFIVDTSAVVISIDEITDNEGVKQDPLSSGDVTDDTTPTLGGKATPGATVNVYLDGVLLQANVPVNSKGEWTYTVAPALTEGDYVFSATVVTPAGGESAPTDDFSLEVDLTASAAPTIDSISDDVGDTQDPLENGSTTDDTTPTLRGSGVAGDVVFIRNNGVIIGSETVGLDNKWSFTPNPPLNNGTTNQFDLVAQDPAGNESVPSKPWTIIIDTDAPAASAVVDSMGKDSGSDSADFLTNDGSAGRLIQGSLTAALAIGEKVQVSTDGGSTWLDAVVDGDSWSFVDQSSHTGDWVINTRVINGAGNATGTEQSVTMDGTAPDSPTGIKLSGTTATVSFDGTELNEGDKVQIIADGVRMEYVLKQADIDAGTVDFTVDASTTDIKSAIIDAVGNTSGYFRDNYVETFDLYTGDRSPSTTKKFEMFRVDTGSGAEVSVVDYGGNDKLYVGWGSMRMSFNERISGISMDLVSRMPGQPLQGSVKVYGPGGELLATLGLGQGNLNYIAPEGKEITSLLFNNDLGQPNTYTIDDVRLNGIGSSDIPIIQTVSEEGNYYGGADDNIFNIENIISLDNASTSIMGGAGVDTLKLTGAGQILDLSAIAGKLQSVEVIDITGTGNNTLTLSLGDVLEQGGSSLFTAEETVQMMIKGNAGDIVNLDDLLLDGTDPGDWATNGTTTVAGVVYNVYQHSTHDAELLVQQGVTTNLV